MKKLLLIITAIFLALTACSPAQDAAKARAIDRASAGSATATAAIVQATATAAAEQASQDILLQPTEVAVKELFLYLSVFMAAIAAIVTLIWYRGETKTRLVSAMIRATSIVPDSVSGIKPTVRVDLVPGRIERFFYHAAPMLNAVGINYRPRPLRHELSLIDLENGIIQTLHRLTDPNGRQHAWVEQRLGAGGLHQLAQGAHTQRVGMLAQKMSRIKPTEAGSEIAAHIPSTGHIPMLIPLEQEIDYAKAENAIE